MCFRRREVSNNASQPGSSRVGARASFNAALTWLSIGLFLIVVVFLAIAYAATDVSV
jgi:hypothetical protein